MDIIIGCGNRSNAGIDIVTLLAMAHAVKYNHGSHFTVQIHAKYHLFFL
jgi:hypothetical protein